MSTWLELQDEALGDDFLPAKYRTLTKRFLNRAASQLARRGIVRALEDFTDFNTTVGDATQTIDTDFVRLRSVLHVPSGSAPQTFSLIVGAPINTLTEADLGFIDNMPITSGKPSAYALDGADIRLYPTPDAIYPMRVRYWRKPTAMTTDGTTYAEFLDYEDMLVAYARAQLFALEDDVVMMQFWQSIWDRRLAEFLGQMQQESRAGKRRIRGIRGR